MGMRLQGGGPSGGSHQGRHTTEDGPGMQSILERNDLDELMAMVGRGAVQAIYAGDLGSVC